MRRGAAIIAATSRQPSPSALLAFREQRQQQNAQIEPERPIVDVVEVVVDAPAHLLVGIGLATQTCWRSSRVSTDGGVPLRLPTFLAACERLTQLSQRPSFACQKNRPLAWEAWR